MEHFEYASALRLAPAARKDQDELEELAGVLCRSSHDALKDFDSPADVRHVLPVRDLRPDALDDGRVPEHPQGQVLDQASLRAQPFLDKEPEGLDEPPIKH